MQVKKVGDTLLVRIDRGEEIVASLLELARKEQIQLASVTGLGAVDHVVFGTYGVEQKAFTPVEKNGEMEVTALVGNLTRQEGEPYLHLHITLADATGGAFGGHLKEARISGTSEIFVRVLEGQVGRTYDPLTGLQLWQF